MSDKITQRAQKFCREVAESLWQERQAEGYAKDLLDSVELNQSEKYFLLWAISDGVATAKGWTRHGPLEWRDHSQYIDWPTNPESFLNLKNALGSPAALYNHYAGKAAFLSSDELESAEQWLAEHKQDPVESVPAAMRQRIERLHLLGPIKRLEEILKDVLADLTATFPDLADQIQGTAEAIPAAVATAKDGQYVFRKRGEMWQLTYDGREVFVKDSKGLRYLAYLLANPGKDVGINELFLAVNPPPQTNCRAALIAGQSPEELAKLGLRISDLRETPETPDPTTKKAYERRLERLRINYAAQSEMDPARAAEIKDEMDRIEKALGHEASLARHASSPAGPPERKRKAITNRIANALTRLDKEHRTLGCHLRNAITTGLASSYKPDKPIPWAL